LSRVSSDDDSGVSLSSEARRRMEFELSACRSVAAIMVVVHDGRAFGCIENELDYWR
jgi:hypothetical protein